MADIGGDAEFFREFPGEGGFGGLAGLDLAAGELPFEGHGLVGAALADEDLALEARAAKNQCGDDMPERLGGGWDAMPVEFADRLFHIDTTSVDVGFGRLDSSGVESGQDRSDGGREVDWPAGGGTVTEQVRRGVYGEGCCCDGEHGGVVDGVAEDGVRSGDPGAAEGGYFAFVGGYIEQAVGGEAIFDGDAGAKDAVGWDVEALDAFFDDPVAGGADGPDVDAGGLELGDEFEHFREDVALDVVGEEVGGGAAEFGFAEALVDLDHLAADGELGDLAALVAGVAVVEPVGGVAGEQAGVHGPAHEGGACVAGPEGAVAVENGDFGGELENAGVELCGGESDSGCEDEIGQAGLQIGVSV